jgi:hypothetical protein
MSTEVYNLFTDEQNTLLAIQDRDTLICTSSNKVVRQNVAFNKEYYHITKLAQ